MVTATLLNDGNKGNHSAFHVGLGGNKDFLFDCGDTAYWKMRDMGINSYHLDTIFLTHKHGDHFRGFNQVLVGIGISTQKGNPKTLGLYAPPGTDALVEHKLEGDFFSKVFLDLFVNEISLSDKKCTTTKYECRDRDFERIACGTTPLEGGVVYDDKTNVVRALEVDHNIPDVPCLNYFFHRRRLKTNIEYIKEKGAVPGKWISQDLKDALLKGKETVKAPKKGGGFIELSTKDAGRLDTTKISYITDLNPSEEDIPKISGFAFGSDLMICDANHTTKTVKPSNAHMSALDAAKISRGAFDSKRDYKRIGINLSHPPEIKGPVLVLTHLAPMVDEKDVLNEAKTEYYQTVIGEPGMQFTLV